MSGYIYQCVDSVEPIADSLGEQWGNAAIYNVVDALTGGCAVSYDAVDMTADLAAGVITHFGSTVTVAAAPNGYTFVSDPTNPRWTWTAIDSAGAPVLISGSPAAIPAVPELGDRVATSLNLVQAGQTVAANIIYRLDKRVPYLSAFDAIRNLFRVDRRLVAEFAASVAGVASSTEAPTGLGFSWYTPNAGDTAGVITGEIVQRFAVAAAMAGGGVTSGQGAGATISISPSHSPRFLCRVLWPAASANNTFVEAGLFGTFSATASGAYLRVVTTGNVFFVTRQGGAETVTDLGVLSRTAVLGFEIESVDAGVTWVCRNQAGTLLATHTTNVPTAAAALAFGMTGVIATGASMWGVAYMRVEGTFD